MNEELADQLAELLEYLDIPAVVSIGTDKETYTFANDKMVNMDLSFKTAVLGDMVICLADELTRDDLPLELDS